MPYSSSSDKSLPSYVKKLSEESRRKWVAIFNHFHSSKGEKEAFVAANAWLKKHMQKHMEARSTKVREVIRFSVDTSTEFIKRSDNGEEYIDAMLQDVFGDKDGVVWTPEVLARFAEQINNGQMLIGDIDHEEYDRILSAAMTDEEVEAMFRNKKGIAKSVKAIFKDGQLWVRSLIDKRYKKAIENAKGVSLEAVVTKDDMGRVTDGKLLGWTFTVNEDPANPRTTVMA